MEIVISLVLKVIAAMFVMMNREAIKSLTAYAVTHPVYRDQLDISGNWFKYVDPIGVCMMVLMDFGWQKPHQYRSSRFRDKKQGTLLIAITGFMANIITIAVLVPLLNVSMNQYLHNLLVYIIYYSVSITIVNLFPIPPLDMSKIIKSISPHKYMNIVHYETYLHIGFVIFAAIGFGSIMMSGLFSALNFWVL